MMAKHIKGHNNVRILSLGTGVPFPSEYNLDGWNSLDYSTLSVELMIDIDVDMADYQLETIFKQQAKKLKTKYNKDFKNYLRA